jgi:hypothetical protein
LEYRERPNKLAEKVEEGESDFEKHINVVMSGILIQIRELRRGQEEIIKKLGIECLEGRGEGCKSGNMEGSGKEQRSKSTEASNTEIRGDETREPEKPKDVNGDAEGSGRQT